MKVKVEKSVSVVSAGDFDALFNPASCNQIILSEGRFSSLS
jgi:hypothetical protein